MLLVSTGSFAWNARIVTTGEDIKHFHVGIRPGIDLTRIEVPDLNRVIDCRAGAIAESIV